MQRTFVKKADLPDAKTIAATVGHQKLLITCEEVAKYVAKQEAQPSNARADVVVDRGTKEQREKKQPRSEGRLRCAAAREAAKGTRGLV